jgi:hypothetical protein
MRKSKHKSPGRPSLGAKAKKRFNVMLSSPVAAKLREFGDNNLSGGIEYAVPAIVGTKPAELARALKSANKQKGTRDNRVPTGFGANKPAEAVVSKDSAAEAVVNVRNPVGFKLTQQQRDESTRQSYWSTTIRYGLEYYVAGRFATAHGFNPISANILHHAVELLLKACLAHDDPLERILDYWHPKKGYGHDIVRLWEAFKARQTVAVPTEFDEIITSLHAFEDIRYPETLIRDGAMISIGIFEVEHPALRDGQLPEKLYVLMLPQIDRLMGFLFKASGANPPAFLPRVTDDGQALVYYNMLRPTFFGRPAIGSGTNE